VNARRSLLAVLLLCGCSYSNKVVSLAPSTAPVEPKRYVELLKRWSRHGDLRSDFDATMIVDATLFSPEFHAAYVAKYLDVYKVTPSARDAVAATIPLDPDTYLFHVETQTHTWEVNELKPPKAIWRLSLLDDTGREALVREVKSENTRTEFLQVFYPYTQLFSKPWRVVFPKTLPDGSPLVGPETKSLTLRIAGPAGAVDVTWRLK
jgi:hypothetical protein